MSPNNGNVQKSKSRVSKINFGSLFELRVRQTRKTIPQQISPPTHPRFLSKERKQKNRAPLYTAISVRDPLVMVAQLGCSQMSNRSTDISLILQGTMHAWSMSACQLKGLIFSSRLRKIAEQRLFLLQIAANVELHAALVFIAHVGRFWSEDVTCFLSSEYCEPWRLPRCYKNYSQNSQLYEVCMIHVVVAFLPLAWTSLQFHVIGEEYETCLYGLYPK